MQKKSLIGRSRGRAHRIIGRGENASGDGATQTPDPGWVRIQEDCRRTGTVRSHATRTIAAPPLAAIGLDCQAGRIVDMPLKERRSPPAPLG